MSESRRFAGVEGLVIEAVEWLPSGGGDAGLLRVRGRWAEAAGAGGALPDLRVGSGTEARRFESLPDARFARDPSVWRGTYLVPPELMEHAAAALRLAWPGGEEVALPPPAADAGAQAGEAGGRFGDSPRRGAGEPGEAGGSAEPGMPSPDGSRVADPSPVRGGEVIDRAVLAERRARRAEAAERSQARRADEALKAVEALELRSAELERRLAALQAAGAAREEEPGGEAAQAALTAALASLAHLRSAAHDQRLRLRASELQRSADAVALAALRSDPESAVRLREALREREDELDAALERAGRAEAAVVEARRQAGEQVAAASRRAAADAAAVRDRVRADLDAARDEAESARAEARAMRTRLAAATDDLGAERAAHAEARERLAVREAELQAIAAELAGARAELEQVRSDAAAGAGELEAQLAELATERDGRLTAATALVTAHSRLAAAEASHRAESVARAVLEEQLDRERAAREALAAAVERADADGAGRSADDALTAARADAARSATAARAAETALRELERRLVALEYALAEERAARGAAEAALGEERAARIVAEAALSEERAARVAAETARDALSSAGAGAGTGLHARIAEIERTASADDLEQRAADQAAAAAALQPAPEQAGRLSADLDAAAAALRARTAPPEVPADGEALTGEGAAIADGAAADTAAIVVPDNSPAIGDEPPAAAPADALAATAPSSPADPIAPPPAAAPAPVPRAALFVPSHAGVPVLRGALVKMAHEEPGSAARLLLALLPALRAIVATPLDFDLTIRGTGTYAVTLGAHTWSVLRVAQPRPRTVATCHIAADVATLAELVAGADKRLGRWLGPVRVKGRRHEAEALAAGVRTATVSLPEAVRAGASLPPDLVFRGFAHVIDPAWTRGHRFTVAQHVTGPAPTTMHVLVRDGAPILVQRWAPPGGPDASVTMSPAAYDGLLRAEPLRAGDRPVVRGNRGAVALLKMWTDRAQGLGA